MTVEQRRTLRTLFDEYDRHKTGRVTVKDVLRVVPVVVRESLTQADVKRWISEVRDVDEGEDIVDMTFSEFCEVFKDVML